VKLLLDNIDISVKQKRPCMRQLVDSLSDSPMIITSLGHCYMEKELIGLPIHFLNLWYYFGWSQ